MKSFCMFVISCFFISLPSAKALPFVCTLTLDPGADLQASIDSLAAQDVLCLNPGTYVLSNPLVISKSLNIIGTDGGNRPQLVAAKALAQMLDVSTPDHVTFQDLDFRGANKAVGAAIQVHQGSVDFLHLNIQDIGQSSNISKQVAITIVSDQGLISAVQIQNSTFTNIAAGTALGFAIFAQGPVAKAGYPLSGLNIRGNVFDRIGRTAIAFQKGVASSFVVNNTIKNTGVGSPWNCIWDLATNNNCVKMSFESYSPATTNENYIGRDNVIEGNHVDHWISLSNTTRTAVRGNFVDRSISAPNFTGDNVGIENTSGTNNVIDRNRVTGRHVVGISASAKTVYNLYSFNTIQGSASDYTGEINYGFQIMGGSPDYVNYNYYVNNIVNTTYIAGKPSANVLLGAWTAHQVFAGNSFQWGSYGFQDTGSYRSNSTAGVINGLSSANTYSHFSSGNVSCPNCITQLSAATDDFTLVQVSDLTWQMNHKGNARTKHWLVDWGHGPPVSGTGNFATLAHTYEASGTFTVSLVVWDDGSNGSGEPVPTYRSHVLKIP